MPNLVGSWEWMMDDRNSLASSNLALRKVLSLKLLACMQIMEAIEALDLEHLCTDYWAGKFEREAASAGLPMPSRAGSGRAAGVPRCRGGKRTRCATDQCLLHLN